MSLDAGTDLSCSIWTPGFNTLGDAVHQGLATEAQVTQAAERLYTGRMQLGLFDPQGSNPLDHIAFAEAGSAPHRATALKAAEESIVLLKNNGILPLKGSYQHLAVVGPTADLLVSILGNYVGTAVKPVTPLQGLLDGFHGKIDYAQGSTLADGVGVPVPRTAFGLKDGLKTEFFATPDWTGRPVAVTKEPLVQSDWRNAKPAPEIETTNYSVRWSGTVTPPAAGHYVFSIEPADAFPYTPVESYRLLLDGKVLGEGSLREGRDLSAMGNFKSAPGASPTAPPEQLNVKVPSIPVDFSDTKPHEFVLEYSHSADRAGGGVTLKWEAPAQAQIDEAVAHTKDADVVVACVGLSPELEGEEMPIKIEGFNGGDRTSLNLPAPQQKLLEALSATGKPLVVVLQSGSAVALNWANEHAAAILQAWYPGVEGGTAIRQTLEGINNPAGRLPVTFYAGLDGLPAFTDYGLKGRTYRYFTGKPLWGFGYGLSYSTFKYGPVKLSATTLKAGDPLTATVTVSNNSAIGGDEVVQAYLKTPQSDGPIHSLVAFKRLNISGGTSREVALEIDPRSLSSVDDQGNRAILPGKYKLSVGGAQPQDTENKLEMEFTVTGTAALPK
jgi:beta-glucosidase